MRSFFRSLPFPFYFGCVLLLCVGVAATATVCGHQSALSLVGSQQAASTPTTDAVCPGCIERDTLLAGLRNEIAEVRRDILAAREKRINARLVGLNERLDADQKQRQTAPKQTGPRQYVASPNTVIRPTAPCPNCNRHGFGLLHRRQ